MKTKTAYRNRIYPSVVQKEQLNRDIDAARFVWNHSLGVANESSYNYLQSSRDLTQLKKTEGFEWLKDSSDDSLRQSLVNLNDSFTRFFNKQNRYPKFKSRDNFKQSVRYQSVELLGQWIKIPKCGWIKLKLTRDITDQPKMITVTREDDKWFASFTYECELEEIDTESANLITGIDLGIKDFAITTNEKGETEYHNMADVSKLEKRKKRYQRIVSRRQKGSNRKKKARHLLSKTSRKIADVRKDFHHKLSNKLTSENQALAIENLNVKGMMKNRHLSRSIQNSGWSQFVTYLLYKAARRGCEVIRVDRWFPSSKTCSECGEKNDSLLLKDRVWTCGSCGSIHNRDENAARNLAMEGIKVLYPEALGNLRSWSDLSLFLDNYQGINSHLEARMKMVV